MNPTEIEVKDPQTAREWMHNTIHAIGLGFHPDTPFECYIRTDTGERLFTTDQAETFNQQLDQVFRFIDPYGFGLYLFGKLIKRKTNV